MNSSNSNDTQSSVILTPSPVVKKQIPVWKFLFPLLFQLILILAVPSQAFYTQVTGKLWYYKPPPLTPMIFSEDIIKP